MVESLPPTNIFQYPPLDTRKRQIRLLRIHQPSENATPSCELRVFDLCEVSTHYLTLSYTWNNASTPTRTILLNNQPREVGANLYSFLHLFGNDPANATTPWLWVDQVCINQDALLEKNHQVRMMSDIYRSCRYVIAWLGCHSEMTHAAQTILSHGIGPAQTSAAESLLANQYFRRLWIVQELLLAPAIHPLVGSIWLDWSELQTYVISREKRIQSQPLKNLQAPGYQQKRRLYTVSGDVVIYYPHNVMSAFCLLEDSCQADQHHKFYKLLLRYCGQQCRDDRDRVYGLLGLVRHEDCVAVDYDKSIIQVYVDAIAALMEEKELPQPDGLRPVISALARSMKFTPEMMGIVDEQLSLESRVSQGGYRLNHLSDLLHRVAPPRFTQRGLQAGLNGFTRLRLGVNPPEMQHRALSTSGQTSQVWFDEYDELDTTGWGEKSSPGGFADDLK